MSFSVACTSGTRDWAEGRPCQHYAKVQRCCSIYHVAHLHPSIMAPINHGTHPSWHPLIMAPHEAIPSTHQAFIKPSCVFLCMPCPHLHLTTSCVIPAVLPYAMPCMCHTCSCFRSSEATRASLCIVHILHACKGVGVYYGTSVYMGSICDIYAMCDAIQVSLLCTFVHVQGRCKSAYVCLVTEWCLLRASR